MTRNLLMGEKKNTTKDYFNNCKKTLQTVQKDGNHGNGKDSRSV